MCVIVVSDRVEVVRDRSKVSITFIHNRSRAIDILEAIYGEAVVGITKERTMLPWSLNVVAS